MWPKCIEGCEHVKISQELQWQAIEDEENLAKQKGIRNPSTLPLNARRDYFGSIAHNGVLQKVEEYGLHFQKSSYFDISLHADVFDFLYEGSKVDVQGTPIRPDRLGNRIVRPWTSYLVKDEKEAKDMDQYCFTSVDLERRILHIAGLASYGSVWRFDAKAENVPHRAHQVYARDLTPLKRFIFRV